MRRRYSTLDLVRFAIVGTCALSVALTSLEIATGGPPRYLTALAYAVGGLVVASTWVVPSARAHVAAVLIGATYLITGWDVFDNVRWQGEMAALWVMASSVGGAVVVASLVRRARWLVPYLVQQTVIIGATAWGRWDTVWTLSVVGGVTALNLLVLALTFARTTSERRRLEARRALEAREADLVAALEAAETALRAKSAFLAAMSHEVRTPLVGVLTSADLLAAAFEDGRRAGAVDLDEAAELTGVVQRGGQRLLRTLESVLELSRLEAEAALAPTAEVDVAEEVRAVARALSPAARDRDLTLHVELSSAPSVMWGDRHAVRQVVQHLVHNAITYTPAGHVGIGVRTVEGAVEIVVEDTGIGIADDHLATIFEPFRQASEGHGRAYEGVGLGLSLVRRLTRSMGGVVEAESEIGAGSRFTVRVPQPPAPVETAGR